MVGVGAFLGSFCGLKLVPAKWRYLIPPTSTPQKHAGHNASRWAANREKIDQGAGRFSVFIGSVKGKSYASCKTKCNGTSP
jgi:hypothetical protein